jgi:hypothetical protein
MAEWPASARSSWTPDDPRACGADASHTG